MSRPPYQKGSPFVAKGERFGRFKLRLGEAPDESAPIAANFNLGREESYLWVNFRPYSYQKSSPLAAYERLPIKNHHLSGCRLTPTYRKESPFAGESGQPIKKVHLSRFLRCQGG
jgi:hypothetical protein